MFFLGKLSEDSLPLFFRCEPTQGDRDAGFRLIKAERADLCSVLLKADTKAREVLTPEIFEALANLNKDWVQDSEKPRLLEDGRELVRRVQEIEIELRKMVDELYPNFPGITTLEVAQGLLNYYCIQLSRKQDAVPQQTVSRLKAQIQNFEDTKKTADTFCKSDQLFRSYVSDGLGKRMGLGCQSALLFAQESGINLRIWCPVSEKKDLLVPECSSRHVISTPVIDLLWHEDKSHFDSLSLQPLQPSEPASSSSTAVMATQRPDPVEGAPSLLIQNLSYRLVFSSLVAERRNAARLLDATFKDSEFLTNILLCALRDPDPVVFQLVDKMLERLRFDRLKQDTPISVLLGFREYSIDRDRQSIVMHNCAQIISISLDHLHKPNPGYAFEVPPVSPLPSLHEYSPFIAGTTRQKGGKGVTLTGGITVGGSQISVGGRTSGMFDNPAGDLPRELSVSASAQPSALTNPSEIRANNFITLVTENLKKMTPDNIKKLATLVTVFWPKVQKDPISIKLAKELYASLPSDIKQKLKDRYPDIHRDLT